MILKPRSQAILIRGWLLGTVLILLCLAIFSNEWHKQNWGNIAITTLFLIAALWGVLKIITTRISIQGSKFELSTIWSNQQIDFDEIKAVVISIVPDFTSIPITSDPKFTKLMYDVIPNNSSSGLLRFDASLFTKEQLQSVNNYFAQKLEAPISSDEAVNRIKNLRKSTK